MIEPLKIYWSLILWSLYISVVSGKYTKVGKYKRVRVLQVESKIINNN